MGAQVIQPQGQFGQAHVNKIVSSKGWYNTKIVLGTFILLVDIIIFGIGGGLAAAYYYSSAYFDMAVSFPVAGLSASWQIAEFITLCVRRDRGIHPGAHVGLHLLCWLGAAVGAGFLTAIVVFDSEDYYYYSSYSSRYRSDSYNAYMAMAEALTAFVYILLILHFTYFVRACIECNRRNMSSPTVLMVAPPGGQGAPMYYMPAPQMVQPMQYMQPPQQPPATYAPPQAGSHNSMYVGYYGAPQTPQPNLTSTPDAKAAELHSYSSSTPVAPSAISTVSSDQAMGHR